jgi:hypothetical protein
VTRITFWVLPLVAPLTQNSRRERLQKQVTPLRHRAPERFAVHVGDHQHLAVLRILHDGGHEPVRVEFHRVEGRVETRTGKIAHGNSFRAKSSASFKSTAPS